MPAILITVRHTLFLTALVLILRTHGGPVSASPHLCGDLCDSSTECTTECYETEIDFLNGNSITCMEYGVYDDGFFCCGDNTCNLLADESCGTCDDDCGSCLQPEPTCGSSGCEQGENCENCPSDCGTCGSSGGSCNDNGECEGGEDKNCEDCQATGFCESTADCPDFNDFTYECIDDRCVLKELPDVTTTCNPEPNQGNDCPSGFHCKLSDAYVGCPPSSPDVCGVCVPDWVS